MKSNNTFPGSQIHTRQVMWWSVTFNLWCSTSHQTSGNAFRKPVHALHDSGARTWILPLHHLLVRWISTTHVDSKDLRRYGIVLLSDFPSPMGMVLDTYGSHTRGSPTIHIVSDSVMAALRILLSGILNTWFLRIVVIGFWPGSLLKMHHPGGIH